MSISSKQLALADGCNECHVLVTVGSCEASTSIFENMLCSGVPMFAFTGHRDVQLHYEAPLWLFKVIASLGVCSCACGLPAMILHDTEHVKLPAAHAVNAFSN